MTRTPRLRVLVPVLVLGVAGLVAVFVLVGALSGRGAGGEAQKAAARDSASVASLGEAAQVPAPASEGVAGASSEQGGLALAVPPPGTYSAHHLVRTGDLSLLVAKGHLLPTVDRITSMTTASGGYVMSSAIGSDYGSPIPLAEQGGGITSTDDRALSSSSIGSSPYATLTLRVPERSFDATLKRFAELGKVESVSTSSEDVTSQYVDLQARLRHYRAVEARLVRFLAQTDNINEMLAVQDRIDKVQLTIEQLSAQLKSLRDTTTYGTLSIFVREKGAPVVVASTSGTFTGTLWHSLVLLGRGARITGLALTAILPFVVVFGAITLAVWYVVRRVRRGRARTAQPSLPA
jgi:hypothetical protein